VHEQNQLKPLLRRPSCLSLPVVILAVLLLILVEGYILFVAPNLEPSKESNQVGQSATSKAATPAYSPLSDAEKTAIVSNETPAAVEEPPPRAMPEETREGPPQAPPEEAREGPPQAPPEEAREGPPQAPPEEAREAPSQAPPEERATVELPSVMPKATLPKPPTVAPVAPTLPPTKLDDPVAPVLPKGELKLSVTEINAFIAANPQAIKPLESLTFNFLPNQLQADMEVSGIQTQLTAEPIAEGGRIKLVNAKLSGLGALIPIDEVIGPLEQQINSQLSAQGRAIKSVKLEQDVLIVEVE